MSLPPGFVDLHTHIIPAFDDGPADMATAVSLLRVAVAGGSGVLVATSHSEEVLQHGGGYTGMRARLDAVQKAAEQAGIAVALLLGCEIYLEPTSPEHLRRRELLTINDSRYVLIELPFQALPIYVDQTLFALQTDGYIPVIAHPERNAQVQQEPERLFGWVSHGALVQISAASLTGGFGRAAARVGHLAISHRLCHVIASDAHDPKSRTPDLQRTFELVREDFGADAATALLDTQPRAIVENQQLNITEPQPIATGAEGNMLRRLFGRG